MGTRLARIEKNGTAMWGVYDNDTIAILQTQKPTLHDMLSVGKAQLAEEVQSGTLRTVAAADVTFLSPVTWPSNIVCQGANYSTHREEAGLTATKPPFNLIFNKAVSSLTGAYAEVIKPAHVAFLDYEIELGLVMGKAITETTHVTADNIADYVAGLVIVNDISARDVQLLEGQWYKGKSYRTFGPTGPYIYLLDADEYDAIEQLNIELLVNDEVRQAASTSQLLFKPAETITELSGIIDFAVGDVIITGTTGGVAMAFAPETLRVISDMTQPYATKTALFTETQQKLSHYLQPGDRVTCRIQSPDGKVDLGTMTNTIVSPQ